MLSLVCRGEDDNEVAKDLLADIFEQPGYQQEKFRLTQ
jgi:alkyl sulfatase BDS1-like metallo-beta-lactamase superfamily hydrolase